MLNQPLTPDLTVSRKKRRLAAWQQGVLAGGLVALVALAGGVYTQYAAPAQPPADDSGPAAAPAALVATSGSMDLQPLLTAAGVAVEPAPELLAAVGVEPEAASADGAVTPQGTPEPAVAESLAEAPGDMRAAEAATGVELASAPAAEPTVEAAQIDGPQAALPAPDARPLVERVAQYHVAPGDGLAAIARRFGISENTLRWANTLPADPDLLYVGHVLTVLPVDGVLHTVRRGDTVESLAASYRVPAADLVSANGLKAGFVLGSGQRLLIPGGRPTPVAVPTVPSPAVAGPGEWSAPGLSATERQRFIEAVAGPAQDSQRRTGVPASVTIAQAIHESGWGISKLAREANNYFGIKAFNHPNPAEVYWIETWEVVDGEDVMVLDPFRAYKSLQESIADHGLFFVRNSRYAPARAMAHDARAFAQAIADAGYATDPAYAAKLVRLMDQYDLYQYDLPTGGSKPTSTPGSTLTSGAWDCNCLVEPATPPAKPGTN